MNRSFSILLPICNKSNNSFKIHKIWMNNSNNSTCSNKNVINRWEVLAKTKMEIVKVNLAVGILPLDYRLINIISTTINSIIQDNLLEDHHKQVILNNSSNSFISNRIIIINIDMKDNKTRKDYKYNLLHKKEWIHFRIKILEKGKKGKQIIKDFYNSNNYKREM